MVVRIVVLRFVYMRMVVFSSVVEMMDISFRSFIVHVDLCCSGEAE